MLLDVILFLCAGVLRESTGGACLCVSVTCKCAECDQLSFNLFSSVLFYLIAPIPLAIARRCGSDDYLSAESSALLHEICYFLSACIVVSGFGLPFVLARRHVVSSSLLYVVTPPHPQTKRGCPHFGGGGLPRSCIHMCDGKVQT